MVHLLLVAAGGALGAALRHLVNLGTLRLVGPGFPWGTMVVNLVGSFAMGAFIGWLSSRASAPNELRLFVATGVFGGFTTFSAFSLDFATLWERGAHSLAVVYVLGSVVLSLVAVFLGLALMRMAS